MPANLRPHSNLPVGTNEQPVLYMAFELSWDSWKLAFANRQGHYISRSFKKDAM